MCSFACRHIACMPDTLAQDICCYTFVKKWQKLSAHVFTGTSLIRAHCSTILVKVNRVCVCVSFPPVGTTDALWRSHTMKGVDRQTRQWLTLSRSSDTVRCSLEGGQTVIKDGPNRERKKKKTLPSSSASTNAHQCLLPLFIHLLPPSARPGLIGATESS